MASSPQARWQSSRQIAERLVITGNLILTSPAHLGNGDQAGQVDMVLLRDALDGRPLLQGSSLAGALRNYLRAYEQGWRQPERRGNKQPRLAELLFGGVKADPEGDQSPLIIDDALAEPTIPEIRDGVRIDGKTRTAQPDFKYDLEALPPGTCFPLRLELLLPEDATRAKALRDALALALQGLQQGEIPLGARKSRGYGRCRVDRWHLVSYKLSQSHNDLLAWLASDHPFWITHEPATTTLEPPLERQDQRSTFRIEATFRLASPLLIRSEEPLGPGDQQPDVIQLRDGTGQPVISGTSLAGVLRARAVRVVQTLQLAKGQELLDRLFGYDMHGRSGQPSASRLIVEETPLVGGSTLVQNRVSIDRFTGGAFDTALFSEAPQVGGEVTLTLSIHDPTDADKGLLLLLLKDLWTGDLAIGGTASIGRGRLSDQVATITDGTQRWQLSRVNGRLQLPDAAARATLQKYVDALLQYGQKEVQRGAYDQP